MESKQAKPAQAKRGHSSLLGELFSLVFNLILLIVLAWFFLEIWFGIQEYLSSTTSVRIIVQKILSYYFIDCQSHPIHLAENLEKINKIQNTLHAWCDKCVDGNIIEIFINVIKIIFFRFCLFVEFLPCIFVILTVFIIDGLVQRDKRKFQGARESTLLFHRLKPLAKFSFCLLFFIYLILPFSISSDMFLVFMAALSSLFAMLSIKSFKKYL